jgi:acyl transferase domain-containing protein
MSLTGITFPNGDAQLANIRAVYASAGLDLNQTGYIECHGTGTQAGDCQELQAISKTIASVRSADNPILVGSVKTNIGHLEGAAGIAGLIKGILTLERGRIPPNINFEKGNPNIDFESWKVKVITILSPNDIRICSITKSIQGPVRNARLAYSWHSSCKRQFFWLWWFQCPCYHG